jgi:hypothetical protein
VDPIPEKISRAFARLVWPSVAVTAPDDRDQPLYDAVRDANELGTELKRSVLTSSSEGEIWWRLRRDLDVADVPLVEWYSRTAVVPLWVGQKLKAAAFVSRYDRDGPDVWRHMEVHDAESVTNVLYLGRENGLGSRVALRSIEETAGLADQWRHDLGMLAGRIVNLEGADFRAGVSDYDGILDFLLALNEAATIGKENARLTLKRRVTAPASAVDERGELPAGKEVIVIDAVEQQLGEGQTAAAFKVLEYSFDAAALIEWQRHLVEVALTRVGITPQFVGATGTEGLAASGTALRVRLLPTVSAAEDRAEDGKRRVPHILSLAARLDAKPFDEGGFGRPWRDPVTLPAVEPGPALPHDENEETDRHVAAVSGRVESRETAVRGLHPDWSDEQVAAELDRIAADQATDFGPLTPTTGGTLGGGTILEEG